MVLHVRPYLVSDLPVEAPEEYGPNSDLGIDADSREEASALEGNVGGTDAECLAGVLLEGEDIVGGECQLAALAV